MRGFGLVRCLAILIVLAGLVPVAQAGPPKVKKVLPHFLDKNGKHTTAPSLYERDAYQAYLRKHPEEQSGMRFDVHWQPGPYTNLTLRIELRGANAQQTTQQVLSQTFAIRSHGSRWSSLTLPEGPHRQFGRLTAWRATLWDGSLLVAEQKSFLW